MEGKIPPDLRWPSALETRVAILQKKAKQENIKLPEEVARYIAQNIWSNAKALDGALIRLIAHSTLNATEITLNF